MESERVHSLKDLLIRIREDHAAYASKFGEDTHIVQAKRRLAEGVAAAFGGSFPGNDDRPVVCYHVPGRVEVLGKHTDYAGGHSILAAVDRGFIAIAGANDVGAVRMVEEGGLFPPAEFVFSGDLEPRTGEWANYPMTVAKRLAMNFGSSIRFRGVDIAFGCDLPVGGGMSGSSALMILTFFALAASNGLFDDRLFNANVRDSIDLAMYLACVENGQTFRDLPGGKGVGTFGGSEDHTEILNGKRGMLSVFRFCPTEHRADIAFPREFTLAIAYSGVRAEKTGRAMTHYNLASRRAALAVQSYNRQFGADCALLRDIFPEVGGESVLHLRVVDSGRGEGAMRRSAEGQVSDLAEWVEMETRADRSREERLDLPGRFCQFAEEDRLIIPDTVRALVTRDLDAFGRAVDRSHELSRIGLWNIVPGVDHLQMTARGLGAVAASGFGAGFGGSVYAIVSREDSVSFLRKWRESYEAHYSDAALESQFFLTQPAECGGPLFD